MTRAPSFFESFLSTFGAKPDLRTGEQQLAWNVLGLVEALGHLLGNVGIHHAVMPLVDEQVVWRDEHGASGDLPWLLPACRSDPQRILRPFNTVRAVFEHREGGVHSVIEASFWCRYPAQRPAAVIAFGGRIDALRPQPGEGPAAYRARVQASASNPYAARGHQHAFRTLVSRVREAMPYTFAGATAQETALAARVVRPSANSVRGIVRNGAYHGPSMGQTAWYVRPRYFTPYYDPWDVYYRVPQ